MSTSTSERHDCSERTSSVLVRNTSYHSWGKAFLDLSIALDYHRYRSTRAGTVLTVVLASSSVFMRFRPHVRRSPCFLPTFYLTKGGHHQALKVATPLRGDAILQRSCHALSMCPRDQRSSTISIALRQLTYCHDSLGLGGDQTRHCSTPNCRRSLRAEQYRLLVEQQHCEMEATETLAPTPRPDQ